MIFFLMFSLCSFTNYGPDPNCNFVCCYKMQAVQNFYHRSKKLENNMDSSSNTILGFPAKENLEDLDDGSIVIVNESDLEGYEELSNSGETGENILAVANLACRVQFASQATISQLSCLWLRIQAGQKVLRNSRLRSMDVVDVRVC